MKKTIFCVLMAAALAWTGCDNPAGGGDNGGTKTGGLTNEDGTLTSEAFTSHNTDYSILVRNNTNERLVAFKGDLRADALIGGIPARSTNHGLPKDPALFDRTQEFPLILLTEAQYNANRGSLQSLRNTPFGRVYVFYNKSGDNTVVYELSDKMGGDNVLEFTSPSQNVNIEIRLNGVAGETLGYVPAGLLSSSLYVGDGDYDIFPVFKRYNQYRDVVETIYPKRSNNTPWGYSLSLHSGRREIINLRDAIEGLQFTTGTAWVYVDNQTTSGGVYFLEGTTPRKTQSGYYNIMPTDNYYFQIDMPKVGENYQNSRQFSGWRFGPHGEEVALQVSADDATPAGTITIERDKLYTVTVVGDRNNVGSIRAWINAGEQIDTSGIDW